MRLLTGRSDPTSARTNVFNGDLLSHDLYDTGNEESLQSAVALVKTIQATIDRNKDIKRQWISRCQSLLHDKFAIDVEW